MAKTKAELENELMKLDAQLRSTKEEDKREGLMKKRSKLIAQINRLHSQ